LKWRVLVIKSSVAFHQGNSKNVNQVIEQLFRPVAN